MDLTLVFRLTQSGRLSVLGKCVVVSALLMPGSAAGKFSSGGKPPSSPAGQAVKARVTLSDRESGREPRDSFPCTGRIYAHVSFPDDFAGKHAIEGLWLKPDGSLQEKTAFTVDFSTGGAKDTSFWLLFHDEPKNIFDEFVFGGDYGRRKNSFNGRWTLQIRSDGIFATQISFTVDCG